MSHEPALARTSAVRVRPAHLSANGWLLSTAAAVTCFGGCGSIEQLPLGGTAGNCPVEVSTIAPVRLDMIILLDQSGSMAQPISGGTRWSMVAYALDTFLNDPDSAGIGVALQYFSLPLAGQTVPTDQMFSCVASDYARPAVPMAVLPANASKISQSIDRHLPSGPTPTNTALDGVTTYARAWAVVNPTHRVVIVLATDAEPHGCEVAPTVPEIVEGAYKGTPSIATYVIGVGQLLTSLNEFARAGGTGKAFIIDTSANGTGQFVDAMHSIRVGQGLPCDYAIPSRHDGGAVDLTKVNLDYRPGPDRAKTVPLWQVPNATQCGLDRLGWYYDGPASPQKVRLCDQTCSQIRPDIHGEMNISVGCQTRIAAK
jgi:hypothetical protein